MDLTVSGTVWEWRGPAPYHFVTVPDEVAEEIQDVAAERDVCLDHVGEGGWHSDLMVEAMPVAAGS